MKEATVIFVSVVIAVFVSVAYWTLSRRSTANSSYSDLARGYGPFVIGGYCLLISAALHVILAIANSDSTPLIGAGGEAILGIAALAHARKVQARRSS